MSWHDELQSRQSFELIGGQQFPGANLAVLRPLNGSHTAQGWTDENELLRIVELRIDSELALISGDVFDDVERQTPRFSFISESIIYRENSSGGITIACFLDMFDGKPVKKGGLLLHVEHGSIESCHIKTFVGFDLSLVSSPEHDLSVGKMAKTNTLCREIHLDVFHAQGSSVPKIFRQHSTEFANTKTVNSVEFAMERAGVKLVGEFHPDPVLIADELESDGEITNEELHKVLVEDADNADKMRWGAQLLFASRVSATPGASGGKLGVMFDTEKPARQGAAVFLDAIADTKKKMDPGQKKQDEIEYLKLHTTIHELGHVFNLLHTHQKDFDERRTRIGRSGSLSWMAYRRLFPLGRLAGFVGRDNWAGHDMFRRNFREWENFDQEEIKHIRHGPYSEVVMGGTWVAAKEGDGNLAEFHNSGRAAKSKEIDPDLSLELEMLETADIRNGIPVIEQFFIPEGRIRLSYRGKGPLELPRGVAPEDGNVDIWVARAGSSRARRYVPPFYACGELDSITAKPPESMEAPLPRMFGANGWFAHYPGQYDMYAVCRMPDGSMITSKRLRFEVLEDTVPGRELVALLENPRVEQFVALNGSRTPHFECVADLVRKLRQDHAGLTITRQLGELHDWAELRPIRAVSANEEERQARYHRAESLLGLTDGCDPRTQQLLNAEPMRLAAMLVDGYRTVAAYQGRDVSECSHGGPAVAERVARRVDGLLTKACASNHLRDWARCMLKDKTDKANEKAG